MWETSSKIQAGSSSDSKASPKVNHSIVLEGDFTTPEENHKCHATTGSINAGTNPISAGTLKASPKTGQARTTHIDRQKPSTPTTVKVRQSPFDKSVKIAIGLLQAIQQAQTKLASSPEAKCLACHKRSLVYAQKKLDAAELKLKLMNPRVVRVAKRIASRQSGQPINT